MMIDPHVHLRDWNQRAKETLLHGFTVAWQCGISALFEMPNTDPALTTEALLKRRIADGDSAVEMLREQTGDGIFHGIYGGLTADPLQIREMVGAWRALFPRVVGFKLFAGHSTGNMGVISVAEQTVVWKTLAQEGYHGVVAVHAEREDLLRPDRWNPREPLSHQQARPPLAEVASVQTHLALAEAAGFRGTVHIVHVTHEDTAELIAGERHGLPFRLTAGVTSAHILCPASNGWRVNPPIRSDATRQALWRHLLDGSFDWIESDHAPHTGEDVAAGAAGLPGIPLFRVLRDALVRVAPAGTVAALTGERVAEAFEIPPHLLRSHRDEPVPLTPQEYQTLAAQYPVDPLSINW